MYLADTTIKNQSTDDGLGKSALLCLASAILLLAVQALYSISSAVARFVWSDEGKAALESSVFYPTVAVMLLFLVSQLVPHRVIYQCGFYCKRKLVGAWNRIKRVMSHESSKMAKSLTNKSRLLLSARLVIGAIELFCM